jgi:hypothetical protein
VHHVAMCKPGDAFHGEEGAQCNEYKQNPVHKKLRKIKKNNA